MVYHNETDTLGGRCNHPKSAKCLGQSTPTNTLTSCLPKGGVLC